MRISDWSSDVCSSDLADLGIAHHGDGFVRIIEPGKRQTFRKQRLHKLPHDRGSYNFQGSRHRQSSFRAQTESERDSPFPAQGIAVHDLHSLRCQCLTDRVGRGEVLFCARGLSTVKRSEEHTSELQSLMRKSYAVFCLKKKKKPTKDTVRAYKTTNRTKAGDWTNKITKHIKENTQL